MNYQLRELSKRFIISAVDTMKQHMGNNQRPAETPVQRVGEPELSFLAPSEGDGRRVWAWVRRAGADGSGRNVVTGLSIAAFSNS